VEGDSGGPASGWEEKGAFDIPLAVFESICGALTARHRCQGPHHALEPPSNVYTLPSKCSPRHGILCDAGTNREKFPGVGVGPICVQSVSILAIVFYRVDGVNGGIPFRIDFCVREGGEAVRSGYERVL